MKLRLAQLQSDFDARTRYSAGLGEFRSRRRTRRRSPSSYGRAFQILWLFALVRRRLIVVFILPAFDIDVVRFILVDVHL